MSGIYQGYPIRQNNSCASWEVDGGVTWDNWHVCCPEGTYSPPHQYNAVCQVSANTATMSRCANSTWDLYWNEDYFFCCTHGAIGFISTAASSDGDFGCASSESNVNPSVMSTLTPTATGTRKSYIQAIPSPICANQKTAIVSSTSSISSTAAATQATPTQSQSPSSNSTNTGAIAGGVVGGVCGIAIIAVLVWLLLRYRSRALKYEKPSLTDENLHGARNHLGGPPTQSTNPSELPTQSRSTGPTELSPENRSVPTELSPENRSVPSELPAD